MALALSQAGRKGLGVRVTVAHTTPRLLDQGAGMSTAYHDFIASKSQHTGDHGFAPDWLPEWLFDFQADLVEWATRKGRAATRRTARGNRRGRAMPPRQPTSIRAQARTSADGRYCHRMGIHPLTPTKETALWSPPHA